jgi:hypothetical protein
VLQIIFEGYERSVKLLDWKSSEKVELRLKLAKSKLLPSSPLYMLGKCLEEKKKVRVSYS